MTGIPPKQGEGLAGDQVLLQAKLDSLSKQVEDLTADIQYIKSFFVAIEAKKEKLRLKKERKRIERERQAKAEDDRATYEGVLNSLASRPWNFLPAPKSQLSPKEQELVSLLCAGHSEEEIRREMNLEGSGVGARIWAINGRLGLKSREELVEFYLKHQAACRTHSHKRCLYILYWLLNPPPGVIRRRTIHVTWNRTFGRGREFRSLGPRVPANLFDRLVPFELSVLKHMASGLGTMEMADLLKIKERTVRTYLSRIRSHVRLDTGVTIFYDEALVEMYNKYLKKKELAKSVNGRKGRS